MDARLFFVLFGFCLVVQQLGTLGRRNRIAAEHPGNDEISRRKWLLIHGVFYAALAVLIVAWWFGSDVAGQMLLATFVITALVATLTVIDWLRWTLRTTLGSRH